MSRSGYLFPGLLACFAISFGVSVVSPNNQIGALSPSFKEEDKVISDIYPSKGGGTAARGREVYISEGCQACHTQVVRGSESADIDRGWGIRRTVARDHLYELPPVLGASRLGPDLANVGSPNWRNEPEADLVKPAKRDAAWQFSHLYEPKLILRESNMPSYRHLFVKRKISGSPSPDALVLSKGHGPTEGYEIVPSDDAKALVAYLASLDRSFPLKEAGPIASTSSAKK